MAEPRFVIRRVRDGYYRTPSMAGYGGGNATYVEDIRLAETHTRMGARYTANLIKIEVEIVPAPERPVPPPEAPKTKPRIII